MLSSHLFSAMEGLTQSYMFKQKLLNCKPINLSRFVVDLRDRHLQFWIPFSDPYLVTHPPYRLPRYMLLDLPRVLFAVWLHLDFASTPFALKPQLGILPLPLLAIYVRLMIMSRMKSMFSYTARTLR